MKHSVLLMAMVNKPIIQNIDLPACINCVYYNPSYSSYGSSLSKCHKYGKKDIITDVITYDYTDNCRNNENKCGNNGTFFEKDNYLQWKMLKHWCAYHSFIAPPIIILLTLLTAKFYEN